MVLACMSLGPLSRADRALPPEGLPVLRKRASGEIRRGATPSRTLRGIVGRPIAARGTVKALLNSAGLTDGSGRLFFGSRRMGRLHAAALWAQVKSADMAALVAQVRRETLHLAATRGFPNRPSLGQAGSEPVDGARIAAAEPSRRHVERVVEGQPWPPPPPALR